MLITINKTLEDNMPSRVKDLSIAELHFTEQGNMYISKQDGTFQEVFVNNPLPKDLVNLFSGTVASSTSDYVLNDNIDKFNFLIVYKYTDNSLNTIEEQVIVNKVDYANGFIIGGASFNINGTSLTNNGNDVSISIIGMQ